MHAVPVVVVFGPTAVGKTEFLLHFEHIAEIINSDSLQVYRHMSIGTAKPDKSVTQRIPHHLVDCIDPDKEFSAGDFVNQADQLCCQIYNRGKLPIIAGGTGFFLKNFIYGLPESPAASDEVRQLLKKRLDTEGLSALREELHQKDPESWSRIKPLDSYRILRALEVYYTAGLPLSDYKLPDKMRDIYRFLLIGLARDRAELYDRINNRVETMFQNGLPEEYKKLKAMGYSPDCPGLSAIGYKEFSTMEELGSLTLNDVKELIKQNSRNYAKRQITFFKALPDVHWFHPDQWEEALKLVSDFC
ncbi:MAG: tRNA (adenosine(37)-N6)-dimethylallyltransferase MiaA [Spirochaetia bacterium]|nr:tRNA (adenosine(37)-N6)-dimethylallyltransferase MiaA [Spirochaetia bacterium]MBR0318280.1 tRNA (adenosine(37)-N6)-dimethylallyltransferase MiaA [Spirochaetia bacterium]